MASPCFVYSYRLYNRWYKYNTDSLFNFNKWSLQRNTFISKSVYFVLWNNIFAYVFLEYEAIYSFASCNDAENRIVDIDTGLLVTIVDNFW